MTTVDKLVDGISHSVHNGAVLLGLSAWHLYPDLIVLGANTATIKQNDPLVAPGIIVTVGLQGGGPEDSRGVYWSLPLTHVRYYGDPVISKGSVSSSESRLSIDDVWQITLGSLFALWGKEGSNTREAANLICIMWQKCEQGLAANEHFRLKRAACADSWLKYLSDAARRLLQSSGPEHELCKRLVGLGQRRATLFGRFDKAIPILGFTDAPFMNVLRLEERVKYLRKIAPKCCKETDLLVIRLCRYAPGNTSKNPRILQLATAATREVRNADSTYPSPDQYRSQRWTYDDTADPKTEVTRQEIVDAFTSGIVDTDHFLSYLSLGHAMGHGCHPDEDHLSVVENLRAIATASKIYSYMPNATVALNIVTYGPLTKAQWLGEKRRPNSNATQVDHWHGPEPLISNLLLPYSVSRRAAFACVSMFESGGFDLKPEYLEKVMAMSAGDSIFVAAPILCDPAIQCEPYEIRRIVGNIGRAGIAFLIPPSNPRTKKQELESYRVINHDFYDGRLEDSFPNTTLHLGFSGYEFALDVGEHGGRNREAFFLESPISVHDRGEWVADLDALATVANTQVHNGNCQHSTSDRRSLPEIQLVTIDRWEELLDPPKDAAVVRAHKNWLARLAAAAISVKMGNRTILFSKDACWKCHEENLHRRSVKTETADSRPSNSHQIQEGKDTSNTIYIL
ncbi:hypothetical protein MMC28_000437 [Mycoblastus sanguinarius]|nr:hypothetical protein [Mycoblastus sanguinarius]